MLIFQSFKIVTCSFAQLIKGNTKWVTLEINIVVVKYQAAQYGRVGLTKLLFKNISLLIKVCKNSQFKVKIIIFTAILGFVGIELSQVSQLLTISLYLGGLRICNLDNNGGGVLVHILVYRGVVVRNLGCRGIAVHNLSTRCTLAYKINSKTAWVCRINLIKRVRYKASNYIKFRRSKEFLNSIKLVQDFFLSLFRLVLFMYYII